MRLGILGGGQLGRMLALAGHPLGVSTTVFDPAESPCAGQVCGHVRGEVENDFAALYRLAQVSDVVTYEFENVPVETARWLAARVPVYPPPQALEVAQDRVAEKDFLRSHGVPTAPYLAVNSEADLRHALAEIGLPAVLKTRRFGYDGKGQAVVRTPADADQAWQRLGGRELIWEGFVEFDRELSLVAVRGKSGEFAHYPLVENRHVDGILHRSVAPAADTGEELTERAVEFAARVMQALDYVGVFTVEWFQDGPRLIANEVAPRVHNSGHWTIEGAVTSQFENHVRAACGWPLGSTRVTGHAVMHNFVGAVPAAAAILGDPAARLHLYGKPGRPGRKVGHVTHLFAGREALEERLPELEARYARR